ncbi:MAG: phosphorylase [Cyanobacteria bacterium J06621_12]
MLSINTIVVPQGAEYQAVCRGLAKAGQENVQIISIPIGVCQLNQVMADYGSVIDNDKNILILGLCGSLTKAHCLGDLVLVPSCIDLSHNKIDLDAELTAEIQHQLDIKTAIGLTSDRVITQAASKLDLAQQYAATIVEMEGYSYVQELQRRDKSVAMLRVVSDDLSGDLPNLNQAIDSQGNLQTLPMAIALLKQPLAAVRLIKGSLAGLKKLEQLTTKLFTVSFD